MVIPILTFPAIHVLHGRPTIYNYHVIENNTYYFEFEMEMYIMSFKRRLNYNEMLFYYYVCSMLNKMVEVQPAKKKANFKLVTKKPP